MFLVGVAVDGALSGDPDVFLFEGIEERRVVHALHAFPAREHERIFARIPGKPQRRTFRHVKVHVVLQFDGAGEELAWRDYHPAPTSLGARVDRVADRIGAIRLDVCYAAELCDVEIALRKNWWLDTRQDLGH